MKRLAVIGALAALAAAGSGVGTSAATFTAHDAFRGTVTTASDWVAPALTLTAPADGSYQKTTTVTLSGAAGNATGDDTTVTVNVYAGTTATGTPTLARTVPRSGATWTTSVTTLPQGTYTAQAAQSDSAGNTTTSATRTFTIDTAAPTGVSMSAVNGSGTAGHLDAGDTITFTFSERMLPSSILSAWNGASATPVKVRFFNGNGNNADSFTVLDTSNNATLKLENGAASGPGGVTLGGTANYVTGTVTFAATMTQSSDGKSFTIALTGSSDNASKIAAAAVAAKSMTWTPKAGSTDMAGNALVITQSWSETDVDKDF